MSVKLRQGLNRATEWETTVGTLSVLVCLCTVFLCRNINVSVCLRPFFPRGSLTGAAVGNRACRNTEVKFISS